MVRHILRVHLFGAEKLLAIGQYTSWGGLFLSLFPLHFSYANVVETRRFIIFKPPLRTPIGLMSRDNWTRRGWHFPSGSPKSTLLLRTKCCAHHDGIRPFVEQTFSSRFTAPSALRFFSMCAGGDNAARCSDTLYDTERQRHLLTLLASDLSPNNPFNRYLPIYQIILYKSIPGQFLPDFCTDRARNCCYGRGFVKAT